VLPPRPAEVPAWDSLSPAAKQLFARQMEVFAAQLTHADREFGRILDALEGAGELDDTIVIVTSDNGASGEGGPHGTFSEMLFMNGVEPTLEQNLAYQERWGGPETYPHYSIGWAMAGNTPFQFYKQSAHAGGVHDPLVLAWPKGIRARGELRPQYHHMVDLAPTLLGLIGVEAPAELDGVAQQPFDGVDMRYSIAGAGGKTRKREQYYEMFGNRGFWADGWKAVVIHNRKPWNVFSALPYEQDVWELYHQGEDWNESREVSREFPAKLAELKQRFEAVAQRNHVFPLAPSGGGWAQLVRERRAAEAAKRGLRYVYRPPADRIPDELAPPFVGQSWTLRARIDVPQQHAEGVIASQGGRFGGWSLYLDAGRPRYVYNYLGVARYAIEAPSALPPGATELRLEFRAVPPLAGVASLHAGRSKLGETRVEHLVPGIFALNESFDIGRDGATAASSDYSPPFAFRGELERVEIQIEQPTPR
jgi:arylsulfatase